MGTRIHDTPRSGLHRGVRLEVDGVEIPELTSVHVECWPDAAVTITAQIYATTPLDLQFENPHVTLIRNDITALNIIKELVDLLIAVDDAARNAKARAVEFLEQT